MFDLKYSNKILDNMIFRCSESEYKNILINSQLDINWHGMDGNYNDCSASLLFTRNNYFLVKDKNLMNYFNDLLVESIPMGDYVDINRFSIGIIDEGISFNVSKEDIEKDLYRLARLININHSSYLVSIFTEYSMKYSSLISEWYDVSGKEFEKNNVALDRNKVKQHSLVVLGWLKKYYQSIDDNSLKEHYNYDKNKFDVFISHANVDKLDYVEKLKTEISKLGVNVFYDKDVIEWGDKWKDIILKGIERSRFAIIVISKNFFDREWTEKELKSFLEKQNKNNQKIILPILYNVEAHEVFEKYPALSDIQFIKASDYDYKDISIKFAKELLKDLR